MHDTHVCHMCWQWRDMDTAHLLLGRVYSQRTGHRLFRKKRPSQYQHQLVLGTAKTGSETTSPDCPAIRKEPLEAALPHRTHQREPLGQGNAAKLGCFCSVHRNVGDSVSIIAAGSCNCSSCNAIDSELCSPKSHALSSLVTYLLNLFPGISPS